MINTAIKNVNTFSTLEEKVIFVLKHIVARLPNATGNRILWVIDAMESGRILESYTSSAIARITGTSKRQAEKDILWAREHRVDSKLSVFEEDTELSTIDANSSSLCMSSTNTKCLLVAIFKRSIFMQQGRFSLSQGLEERIAK